MGHAVSFQPGMVLPLSARRLYRFAQARRAQAVSHADDPLTVALLVLLTTPAKISR
jgi:hypothetical protein